MQFDRILISVRVSARGTSSPSPMGIAEGATGCQPPSSGRSDFLASQGAAVDALRPAWASWIASFACPCARQNATMGRSAASFASE